MFLPITIIWVVGYPMAIFFLLRRNKPKFNEDATIIKYGFFYIGLNDRTYYYEIVITNIRKVLIAAIASSLSTYN
jgi:hypothetical protein